MKKISKILCFLGIIISSTSYAGVFLDVDVTHPRFYAVDFLRQNDVVKGYEVNGELFFKSTQKVLRSEAVKMLVLGSDKKTRTRFEPPFLDVKTDVWFAPFVDFAKTNKFINGFPDGKFHPEYNINRAEFVKMVLKFFEAPVRSGVTGEEWFIPYMEFAKNKSILEINAESPSDFISRGEVAELIYRTVIVSRSDFKKPYIFTGFGKSSYYGEDFAGKTTANGEIFNPQELTAAHRYLPFGTYIRVWNEGKFVIVRINDRGPYHEDRVLDLSKRAFELLAPISRGVLNIEFEIVSGPKEEKPSIPEQIRGKLESQSLSPEVPHAVAEKINPTKKEFHSPIFKETISHLPKDFFPNVSLRRTIPQKITTGTVLNISGRINKYGNTIATFFLEDVHNKKQTHFKTQLSGKNFEIPVSFLKAGEYQLGFILDNETVSRVENIEVVDGIRKRWFPSSANKFSSNLDVLMVPEEKKLEINITSNKKTVSKINIQQGDFIKTLYIEDGLEKIEINEDFFDIFESEKEISFKLFQAGSTNGSLENQTGNWKPSNSQVFWLTEGFPDIEKEDLIAVYKFPRYNKTLHTITLNGRIKDDNYSVHTDFYLETPSGFVQQGPIKSKDGKSFELSFFPEEEGSFVLQILGKNKETLFKRALYFSDKFVLPIKKHSQTEFRNKSIAGIRDWVNQIRDNHVLPPLVYDFELEEIAQKYANHLSINKFLAHTDLNGKTFKNRLSDSNMVGEFGENLSQGTNLEVAVWALESSPAHRKNILTKKWTNIGIGMAQDTDGDWYTVQLFSK